MVRGMRIGSLRSPLASAWNGKVWRSLSSWISPTWLTGTWLAVTTTVSPALTVDSDSVTVDFWCVTEYATPPQMRSKTMRAPPMMAIRPLRDLRLAGGGEDIGWMGSMATSASGTVEAKAGS